MCEVMICAGGTEHCCSETECCDAIYYDEAGTETGRDCDPAPLSRKTFGSSTACCEPAPTRRPAASRPRRRR